MRDETEVGGLDKAWVVAWLRRAAEVIAENRVELILLDRAIGDGDHGENMDRGFQAVVAKLTAAMSVARPTDVLKLAATTLMSTVGGASGPLFATAFLAASAAVADREILDAADVAALLVAARDGVVLRGKAELGDKTMVDAWTPAVEAATLSAEQGADPTAVLAAAADAATRGAESTDPLIARKGRASYFGERAIGHRDPGSVSTALLLRAAAEAAA
ncbi:dihydroxyacetone kinase subunit DhaL [Rathayibacter toxicus]|uniref:Dihydroxyacetone kinase n=1 Tax=Rathayibacter toxicus TaxID=145458 RepID=A0A0C5BE14_9MICO|nr:dihydroxyacetone kinase subunit DhaL [Rathayibacter toxicus]AJM77496.1 dihydroxyacetone kinase [Rathayibacter toxicus]ALS56594.1 dihydroxyacetone kinase [Rathayibacter toxicus]KKM44686.1 dihydroxyacetone kinase [Rathayibacter toxicus]PPG21578.1 dihydroxyacetone kinase subunit L [Rathayibacter toxicus]PPG46542.1 dihydroxyacetone kinase subunit L [Rathayibacter toxicus]